MKYQALTTLVAAAALAFGGAAFAQSSMTPSTGTSGRSATSPGHSPEAGSGISGGSSAAGRMGASTATPPRSIVGKDVVNAAGDKIGDVKSIDGSKVIVSVGGFLGIGDRKVALDWSRLTMSGTGNDIKLKTMLTKDELKSLPEYKTGDSSTTAPRSTTPPPR